MKWALGAQVQVGEGGAFLGALQLCTGTGDGRFSEAGTVCG